MKPMLYLIVVSVRIRMTSLIFKLQKLNMGQMIIMQMMQTMEKMTEIIMEIWRTKCSTMVRGHRTTTLLHTLRGHKSQMIYNLVKIRGEPVQNQCIW